MTQINRFDAFAHISSMKLEPDGDYVLYSDHVAAIAAVRQQAAQVQRPKWEKVRAALNTAATMIECEYCSHENPHGQEQERCYSGFIYAALAELDAAEGKGE